MASIFRNLPTQRIDIFKQNGKVIPKQKAIINTKGNGVTIILEGDPDIVQSGDYIDVEMPEGLTRRYRVLDPGYHPKQFGITPYYSAKAELEQEYFRTGMDSVYTRSPQPVSASASPDQKGTSPAFSQNGRNNTPGPIRGNAACSDSGTQVLFETMRTFVTAQKDKPILLLLIQEMEQCVGTSQYPAAYDAFIQTISDRIAQFAYFIPHLSHLLLTETPRETE